MGIWQDDINEAEANAAAKSGGNEAAILLLSTFAGLAEEEDDPTNPPHPELVRHVARCLARWAESDFDHKGARAAFLVEAKQGRKKAGTKIEARNDSALREYARLRGERVSHDKAIIKAAHTNDKHAVDGEMPDAANMNYYRGELCRPNITLRLLLHW